MKLEENEQLLQDFVAGRLSEADNDAVLAELEQNDAALARIDALWDSLHGGEPGWVPPALDTTRANDLERQLFRRLHRSNLSGNALRFGTGGVGSVFLALTRPLAAWGRTPPAKEERDV